MPSIEVQSKTDTRIAVKLKDVPLQYANALRRICLNGVPVFAIDTIDVVKNTSVLADEGIAHRLGLIPLKTDLSEFGDLSKLDFDDSTNRVMLSLDSGNITETRTVLSKELGSEDKIVKPVSDKVPIVDLAPGQELKLEAYAKLGRGIDHAKWNCANISVLTDSDTKGVHILTIESTGALDPAQIVLAGMDELAKHLGRFKTMVSEITAS